VRDARVRTTRASRAEKSENRSKRTAIGGDPDTRAIANQYAICGKRAATDGDQHACAIADRRTGGLRSTDSRARQD